MSRPQSRWWRAYDAALENPKVQRLSDKLFRTWFNVLCIACRHGGALPPIADVAFLLRLKPNEAKNRIQELRLAGLVDEVDGRLRPHDWDDMQFHSDVSTERVKRFRKRGRNVSKRPNETAPDTETDTEVSLRETRAQAFERFWDLFPHKVGKPVAEKSFGKLFEAMDGDVEPIMAGLQAYIRDKPEDRSWLNPATFLNQRRFDDRPAAPPARAGPQRGRTVAEMAQMDLSDPDFWHDEPREDPHGRSHARNGAAESTGPADQGRSGFAGRLSVEDAAITRRSALVDQGE